MRLDAFIKQRLLIYLSLMESEKTVAELIEHIHKKSDKQIELEQSVVCVVTKEGVSQNLIRYSTVDGLKTYRLTTAGKQLIADLFTFQSDLMKPEHITVTTRTPTVQIKNHLKIVKIFKK